MNSDGLSALVSQLGCEFDGTFIVTDETPGKCFSDINVRNAERKNLIRLWLHVRAISCIKQRP